MKHYLKIKKGWGCSSPAEHLFSIIILVPENKKVPLLYILAFGINFQGLFQT
jgi:hypothetical protein